MKNLDERIQAALRADDAAGTDIGLTEEVLGAFRGRQQTINVVAALASIVLIVVAAWAGCRFYWAEALAEQLRWGGLALVLFLIVLFAKVWFWLEMKTNRVLREVKRLELRLAAMDKSGAATNRAS